MPDSTPDIPVIDLGRMEYDAAYHEQLHRLQLVLASREHARAHAPGCILVVEHDPVITVSRRAGAADHVLAPPALLAREGVAICETDRGGDVTYHGPGQLVIYPILDLNAFNLGLHDYMRVLEESVIRACAQFGVLGERDPGATGVWVRTRDMSGNEQLAKLCAFGVRVRKWISMHGLAINIETNLAHFDLIVPCGLVGRPVTSLRALLGDRCPTRTQVRDAIASQLTAALRARIRPA